MTPVVEYRRSRGPRLLIRYKRQRVRGWRREASQHALYFHANWYMRRVVKRNIRYVVHPMFDEWRRDV